MATPPLPSTSALIERVGARIVDVLEIELELELVILRAGVAGGQFPRTAAGAAACPAETSLS